MIGSQVDFTAASSASWGLLAAAASIATSSAATSGSASSVVILGSLSWLGFVGEWLSGFLRWTIIWPSLILLCLTHHCSPATVVLGLSIALWLLLGSLIVSWPFGCLRSRSLVLLLLSSLIVALRFFGGLRSLLVIILIPRTLALITWLFLACSLLLAALVVGLLILVIRFPLLVLLLVSAGVVVVIVLHTCLVGFDDRFRCLLWFTFNYNSSRLQLFNTIAGRW